MHRCCQNGIFSVFKELLGKAIKVKTYRECQGDVRLQDNIRISVVNGHNCSILAMFKIILLKLSDNIDCDVELSKEILYAFCLSKYHVCNISGIVNGRLLIGNCRENVEGDIECNENTAKCISFIKSAYLLYLRNS